MGDSAKVQETAFVTATYRASDETLSKDPYSSFWKNSKTDIWIENFIQQVSMDEPFLHCLRNRYFFETIQKLIERKEIKVLINLGSGFSMYPFLFPEGLINIEVDHEELIDYKKERIQKWTSEGKLPKREIHYIAKDFNLEKAELESEIKAITQGKPSFVLLEGVIFFLTKPITDELMALISRIQTKGSYLGCVSFQDSTRSTACFKNLVSFFEKEFSAISKFQYMTLPNAYYETLAHYELIQHEDAVSLSKEYSTQRIIEDRDSILNENMYLLKRTS